MTKAMYAFSGDPITFGHIDIITRASKAFDELIVGIGVNPLKKYLFTLEERTVMARQCLRFIPNVSVVSFQGLLVDYAYEQNVSVIVKGVRNAEDFSYENMLHQVGESQKLGIDTHILFARPELGHVSSSAVKEIQRNSGDIHDYVPLFVKQKLEENISGQYLVGVTGEMGAGKSYLCNRLAECGRKVPVHNIELDHIGHDILGKLQDPAYQKVREEIVAEFGKELADKDGFIDRKALGAIVFEDKELLQKLNNIMYRPVTMRLRRELSGKKGLVLINAALLIETDMIHLCNNNVVLIHTDKETQRNRLLDRGLTEEQIQTRIVSQYNFQQKKARVQEVIDRDGHGQIWTVDNSADTDNDTIIKLLNDMVSRLGVK